MMNAEQAIDVNKNERLTREVDDLQTRVAELTKPVDNVEVREVSQWLIENAAISDRENVTDSPDSMATVHAREYRRAVDLLERLARERGTAQEETAEAHSAILILQGEKELQAAEVERLKESNEQKEAQIQILLSDCIEFQEKGKANAPKLAAFDALERILGNEGRVIIVRYMVDQDMSHLNFKTYHVVEHGIIGEVANTELLRGELPLAAAITAAGE